MNPALGLIVILVLIAVWFLASGLFKPIGKFFYKIGKDTVDNLTEEDEESEEEE